MWLELGPGPHHGKQTSALRFHEGPEVTVSLLERNPYVQIAAFVAVTGMQIGIRRIVSFRHGDFMESMVEWTCDWNDRGFLKQCLSISSNE